MSSRNYNRPNSPNIPLPIPGPQGNTGPPGPQGSQCECSCSNLLVDLEIGDFIIVETTCGTQSGTLESVTEAVIQLTSTVNSTTQNTMNICCKNICSITRVLISKIAFTSQRNGNEEIYVMNTDGSNQMNISNNAASDEDPAWSPFKIRP